MYPLHLRGLLIQAHYRVKELLWKLEFFTGDFFGNTWIITKNGHQTHQTLILLITMSGQLCLNATRHFNPSQIPSMSWRKSCKQYGMLCHRTPSTKPYWALYKDFELVWKLGADTLDTSWNKLFFTGFWTVSKLWQSEMSNFHVFVWFQYKHYDENCIFIVIVLHSSVVV